MDTNTGSSPGYQSQPDSIETQIVGKWEDIEPVDQWMDGIICLSMPFYGEKPHPSTHEAAMDTSEQDVCWPLALEEYFSGHWTLESIKGQLNVKELVKVVNNYGECSVVLIQFYTYLLNMSHINDTRCSLSPVLTRKCLVLQRKQP